MDSDLNTGSEVRGRIFLTSVVGNTASEIEIAALAEAQGFFGDGVPLEVVPDYTVYGAPQNEGGKKYAAGVSVRAVVQP